MFPIALHARIFIVPTLRPNKRLELYQRCGFTVPRAPHSLVSPQVLATAAKGKRWRVAPTLNGAFTNSCAVHRGGTGLFP